MNGFRPAAGPVTGCLIKYPGRRSVHHKQYPTQARFLTVSDDGGYRWRWRSVDRHADRPDIHGTPVTAPARRAGSVSTH